MMGNMRKIEKDGGKGSLSHEEKYKREQRNTEEEIREGSRGEDVSEIGKGNADEEMDKTVTKKRKF
ncbi:hypothetical protein GHT06_008927 [Daphnia sinensis]|uniref:Uncharacterized protein n=1 Tax=Daphnia sinensis TaxID=1820382 RepID=A0AAD5L343_9CRUS|nr:hypothetical protein GHT06_008927 [Daphnia sinensis]